MLLCAEGKVELQLSPTRPEEKVMKPTPVIRVIVEKLEQLQLKNQKIPFHSRDFH
ncbi:hypothetical protein D3C83_137890 [compost metagenome]